MTLSDAHAAPEPTPAAPEFRERRLPISAAQLAMLRRLDAEVAAAGAAFKVCAETLIAGHGIARAQVVGTDDAPSPLLIVRVPVAPKRKRGAG